MDWPHLGVVHGAWSSPPLAAVTDAAVPLSKPRLSFLWADIPRSGIAGSPGHSLLHSSRASGFPVSRAAAPFPLPPQLHTSHDARLNLDTLLQIFLASLIFPFSIPRLLFLAHICLLASGEVRGFFGVILFPEAQTSLGEFVEGRRREGEWWGFLPRVGACPSPKLARAMHGLEEAKGQQFRRAPGLGPQAQRAGDPSLRPRQRLRQSPGWGQPHREQSSVSCAALSSGVGRPPAHPLHWLLLGEGRCVVLTGCALFCGDGAGGAGLSSSAQLSGDARQYLPPSAGHRDRLAASRVPLTSGPDVSTSRTTSGLP